MGPFLAAIRNRRDNGTNSNIAVTGEPGIGKSTLSLVSAEDLKPEVFVDHPEEAVLRYVTYTTSGFMKAIKDSRDGSVIIGDEFGQQMHHRKFMRDENVGLSSVLQGFRFKKHISFMNAPGLTYIDKDAKGLLTWMVTVAKRGRAQVYRVTHPLFNGDDYFHMFIDDLRFGMPRPALWKAYVAAKEENQEKVFENSIRMAEKAETVPLTIEDMMKIVNESPQRYRKKWGNGEIWNVPSLEARFQVGHSVSRRLVAKLEQENASSPDPLP